MPTLILFLAFSAASLVSAFVNFKHTAKAHKTDQRLWSIPVVNREDHAIKANGLNLPGYNH